MGRAWPSVVVVGLLVVASAAAVGLGSGADGASSPLALSATGSGLETGFPRALLGSCVRVTLGGGNARESTTRLPHRIIDRFAIFRRAQQGNDGLPKFALRDVAIDLRLVLGLYVRRVGRIASGASYFVVPGRTRIAVSRRCFQRLNPQQKVRQRRLAADASRLLLLCLDDFDNGGADYCYSERDALTGRAFASADGPEPPLGTPDNPSAIPVSVSVLAPDGASTLEAEYPGEAPIDAQIADNFATFVHTIHITPHATAFPNFNPTTAIFKRADGSVLLTSHPRVDAPRFGDR